MRTRRTRDRRNRLVLGVSLAISLALHAIVAGGLTFQPPGPATESNDLSAETPVLQVSSIELVQIEDIQEPVVLDPVITNAPLVLAAPTSEELSEPKSGEALLAASGEAAAAAAAPTGGSKMADDPLPAKLAFAEAGATSTAPSMRPRFGIQQKMPESTRKPIDALEPHADHDRVDGEGEEEESWWRRLGMKFGIGSGGKVCVPRPEVIDTGK